MESVMKASPCSTKVLNAVIIALVVSLAIFVSTSCNINLASPLGALKVVLSSNTPKTLQPGISLDIATYDIYGSGPMGTSFEVLGIGDEVYTKDRLTPGDWTIYAVGKNTSGDIITQSALLPITLVTAQVKTVNLACSPLAGNGSLRIDLSWPADSIVSPLIEATITPVGGSSVATVFTITGDSGVYLSGSTIQNGFHTLSIKLKDAGLSNHLVWSKVESVLILTDQPTTANWVLTHEDIDMAPPSIFSVLSSDPKKPILIDLTGHLPRLLKDSTMLVTATGVPAPSEWQWYLDGDLLPGQISSTATIGEGLLSGSAHTLTVIGKAGTISGSAEARFWVRPVSPSIVSTFVGSGVNSSLDGTGTEAAFSYPYGIVLDSEEALYITDYNSRKIRKVSTEGYVTTIAGSGAMASTDGFGTEASFLGPTGITVDSQSNVYVTDIASHNIRKISPDGYVSTFVGSESYGDTDGLGLSASFSSPYGIAADSSSNLYIADYGNHKIRKVTPEGLVSTYAGTGVQGSTDGISSEATFFYPTGVAVDDATGNIFVADYGNNLIRKITPQGLVTTIAGSGVTGSNDGIGTAASFSGPFDIAIDTLGNLYVADAGNNNIRKVTPEGNVMTLAGSGIAGYEDGRGTSVKFHSPNSLEISSLGDVIVADSYNNRIRRIIQ
jgi:sugar lactone lactonase YvrE